MVREGLIEKMVSEQRLEGDEGFSLFERKELKAQVTASTKELGVLGSSKEDSVAGQNKHGSTGFVGYWRLLLLVERELLQDFIYMLSLYTYKIALFEAFRNFLKWKPNIQATIVEAVTGRQ